MLAHSRYAVDLGGNSESSIQREIVGFSDLESLDGVDQFLAAYECLEH